MLRMLVELLPLLFPAYLLTGAWYGYTRVSYYKRVLAENPQQQIEEEIARLERSLSRMKESPHRHTKPVQSLIKRCEHNLQELKQLKPSFMTGRIELVVLIQQGIQLLGEQFWVRTFIYELLFWLPYKLFLSKEE
ncbi:hypothetical protein [Paenibacillus sp. YYML68]|uniref:hypothetical protein n=1 Tax=Paenibacillus sp. YYML68 TaxID=2909250 RepID=UPI002491F20A|nr:hypothetical protein [Paenibacillus sp. YYML68]